MLEKPRQVKAGCVKFESNNDEKSFSPCGTFVQAFNTRQVDILIDLLLPLNDTHIMAKSQLSKSTVGPPNWRQNWQLEKKAGTEILDPWQPWLTTRQRILFTAGIGKLLSVNRKARMGRNPKAPAKAIDSGQERVVNSRVPRPPKRPFWGAR